MHNHKWIALFCFLIFFAQFASADEIIFNDKLLGLLEEGNGEANLQKIMDFPKVSTIKFPVADYQPVRVLEINQESFFVIKPIENDTANRIELDEKGRHDNCHFLKAEIVFLKKGISDWNKRKYEIPFNLNPFDLRILADHKAGESETFLLIGRSCFGKGLSGNRDSSLIVARYDINKSNPLLVRILIKKNVLDFQIKVAKDKILIYTNIYSSKGLALELHPESLNYKISNRLFEPERNVFPIEDKKSVFVENDEYFFPEKMEYY